MKHLSILIPDDQTTMSTVACIVGSFQVFTSANQLVEKNAGFDIALVGASANSHLQDRFLTVSNTATINEIAHTNLVIIPATGVRSYEMASPNNKLLMDWINLQYKNGAEIASMCAGGFMLASTGLLSGKTCSTHWALAGEFRALHPDVNLQTDKLITDENGIYTNGGAYSFLHLLIYLVEKFYNRETAIHCARYFQVDPDRNLQAGYSVFTGYKKHSDEVVLSAQNYIETNFTKKFSFEILSSDLGVGRRSFDRRFVKATGLTPLDYLQRVKIEVAKRLLESSRKSVNEIMFETGYNDTKAFREVFLRITGMLPNDYKCRYNKNA